MTATAALHPPRSVLTAFGFGHSSAHPIAIGLINQTWRIEADGKPVAVLQRLHPIFAPEVNLDIDVITAHIASRGMPTPLLLRTTDGARFAEDAGETYRALTFLHGRTLTYVASTAIASAAGELAGRLHGALRGLVHEFAFGRAGVHDTAAHLSGLEAALGTPGEHRDAALPIGEAILAHARGLEALPVTRERIVHGDLKITNLLFEADRDVGLAVLDLDTFAVGTLPVELGDALRSWCNPAGESRRGEIDLDIFEAALTGWARSGTAIDVEERDAIALGVETITTELAARFARDAVEDRYFGWDAAIFPSRVAHNRARAASQLALARSVRAHRAELEALARRALGG